MRMMFSDEYVSGKEHRQEFLDDFSKELKRLSKRSGRFAKLNLL